MQEALLNKLPKKPIDALVVGKIPELRELLERNFSALVHKKELESSKLRWIPPAERTFNAAAFEWVGGCPM